MAIRALSYLDLTPAQRKVAADRVRGRLQALLADPLLAPEQKYVIQQQVERVDAWEAGTLSELPSL